MSAIANEDARVSEAERKNWCAECKINERTADHVSPVYRAKRDEDLNDWIDLSAHITPRFLEHILRIRCPWPKHCPLDIKAVAQWSGKIPEDARDKLRSLTWPILKHLSSLGPNPDDVPDLMVLLSTPSAPEFPSQALALLILLDQVPRFYCSQGTDVRWLNSFFDPLAQRLAAQLFSLPQALQPHRLERWMETGHTYDHWFVIALLFLAPLDHTENLPTHQLLRQLTGSMRVDLADRTGVPDPYAEKLACDLHDALAFPLWIRAGSPWTEGDEIQLHEFGYYRLAMTDVHYPIIEKFGRYPWRNAAICRASTKEEVQYLEESGHFAETNHKVVEHIREDIMKGRWTALGEC